MFRIVIVILIYRCQKPIDLNFVSFNKNSENSPLNCELNHKRKRETDRQIVYLTGDQTFNLSIQFL
jgi:hypothetical protein